MHMLFVALGSAAANLAKRDIERTLCIDADLPRSVVTEGDEFLAVVTTPKGLTPTAAQRNESTESLLIDGYITCTARISPGTQASAAALLKQISDHGISGALSMYVAGSFNLVHADSVTPKYTIASDRIGSIPLYFSSVKDGLLLCTNPRVLLATGLISSDVDWTGCASWLYFGYPLGNRHMLRSIRAFPSHSALTWSGGTAVLTSLEKPFTTIVPVHRRAQTAPMAELAREACRIVASVPGSLAHLQSAGMDSRLILAALPTDVNPPCFTYGRADSTEIPIAECVARTRGVDFNHYWPDGDDVAASLDAMFEANGLMVYPDRYLISREMVHKGFHKVTDGFLGDVLLGGSYYKCDTLFGALSRISRYAMTYVDQSVSRIGMDAIARTLFSEMSEVRNLGDTFGFLKDGFREEIENQRAALLDDIRAECARLSPSCDSVGVLFRNFFMQNRSRHAIAQQGVMCRQFQQVLYPFTNDRAMFEACLELSPSVTAYRKFYIRLFREQFPAYAALPYGESLIQLGRQPWIHNFHRMFGRKMGRIRSSVLGSPRPRVSPNNWSLWLSRSRALREKLAEYLVRSEVVDPAMLDRYLLALSRNELQGTGKLFHLAAVANWLSHSNIART